MRRRANLLPWLGLTAGAVLLTSVARGVPGFAALGAMLLVLVLPGHAALSATYPRQTFGAAELATLAIGLSLALSALVSLVLNWTGPGLTRDTWTLTLSVATAGMYLIASHRDAETLTLPALLHRPSTARIVGPSLCALLVAGLVITAFAVAQHGAEQQPRPGFMALGIHQSRASRVVIDVDNRSDSPQSLRLSVRYAGRSLGSQQLALVAGGRTARVVVLPAGTHGGVVSAVLLREGETRPLRSVRLPLPLTGSVTR